jgi:hypothetical protein
MATQWTLARTISSGPVGDAPNSRLRFPHNLAFAFASKDETADISAVELAGKPISLSAATTISAIFSSVLLIFKLVHLPPC